MTKSCKPLGNKLAQFFRTSRPFNSPPPDLTGRKRVYCSGCNKRWIMCEPEMINFHTVKFPWRCSHCRAARRERLAAEGVRVYCVGGCGAFVLLLPSDAYTAEGVWKCLKCIYKITK